MRPSRILSAALLVSLLSGSAAAADFHLEFHAVVPSAVGTWGDVSASDFFGVVGSGFSGAAILQVDSRLAVGARSGMLQNWNEAPASFTVGGNTVDYELERDLTTIPTMALVRYSLVQMSKASVFGEAGLGVHSYTGKVRAHLGDDVAVIDAGYQTEFAWSLGGGISIPLHRLLAVGLGVEFQQAITGDGDLFDSGDNPSFVVSRFGLRYPR